MYNKIPNIRQASLYARTRSQKVVHEILQSEGIGSTNVMRRNF